MTNDSHQMILDTLRFFHDPGEVVELCAFGLSFKKSDLWEGFAGGAKGVVAGWFRDLEKAAEYAGRLNRLRAEGIYHTLNPCLEALLSRSDHRLKAGVARTQDKEISVLRWLLVDVDVKRVSGVSTTDSEHELALSHIQKVKESLRKRGWPDPLIGDSGNGGHLVYRLPELENTAENIDLLKSVLKALNELYGLRSGEAILEIDQKVFNPARISKLYGTMARKGDHSDLRPHRISRLIEAPKNRIPVPMEALRAMGLLSKEKEEKAQRPPERARIVGGESTRLDVRSYLNHYGVPVRKEKENGSSMLYVLETCLFDPSHSGGEAAIVQGQDGTLIYQCFHDSCRGRTWGEARKQISGEDKLTAFLPGWDGKAKGRKAHVPERKSEPGKEAPLPAAEPDMCDLQGKILQFNKDHAVLMLGGKCVIMKESIDPVFHRPDLSFMAVTDFKNFHSNEKHWVPSGNGRSKLMDIGRLWLEAPERRQYEGIVFCPGAKVDGYYNLFRGFAVTPRAGEWGLFSNHIYSVICNENQDIYNYVIAWLAHLFQRPGGERPGTAIVLRGRMGTGKGCFASQIGAILGSHYLHIAQQKQLTGNFNHHLKDTLFCFVDEGIWAGDKQAEGALKAMITEQFLAIEPKGKDVFMVQNFIRLLIATNNDWAIPAGLEERRFLVLDVSEKHLQDHKYFSEIVHQMNNGGREAMLHDLMQLDISGFNLRTAPKTAALFDQILHSMSVAHKFWFEILWDGRLRPEDDEWFEQDVPYSDVFRNYIALSERMREYRPHIRTTLIRELKKLCPGIYTVKRRNENNKLTNYLAVPPLDECRKKFESLINMPLDWDAESVQAKKVVI